MMQSSAERKIRAQLARHPFPASVRAAAGVALAAQTRHGTHAAGG